MGELDMLKPMFSKWGARMELREAVPDNAQPARVHDSLYLGDMDDVDNVAKLQQLKIKTVVNLCKEKLNLYFGIDDRLRDAHIKHHVVFARDHFEFDMQPVIQECCT